MNKEQMQELREAVEKRWLARAEAQELKPGTIKYRRMQMEFFMGAVSVIDTLDKTERKADTLSADVPVIWIINALAGMDIMEKRKEKKT